MNAPPASTPGHWPAIALLVSVISAGVSVTSTIWGEWLKRRFGIGVEGRTQLGLTVMNRQPYHYHGWLENTGALTQAPPTQASLTQASLTHASGAPDDRLRLHFVRVQVTNMGHTPAKAVSLWVKSIVCTNPSNRDAPYENVVPLRWSDFWRFETDVVSRRVTASDTDVHFAMLPAGSSKYCDLCFYYDRSGPASIGRFERARLYLAVLNLPSKSYSMENGSHQLLLHLVAENCLPVEYLVNIKWNAEQEKDGVSVELASATATRGIRQHRSPRAS